ncbi:hypothetical protein [Leucobacter komagatae]|uniref:hypothetical protein n=1 Tax=Leucobacter komagatae TaxID=55969 RepID=UPI0012EEB59F|nr:hypothetical protein [Leucobacter komagatae]
MSSAGAVVHRRRTGLAALAIVVAGGLLAGCAQEPAEPAPTTPAPAPTTPAPEPAPTEAAWERFTDDRLPHSFEVPPGWTVTDLGGDPTYGSFQFGVVNPDGDQLLTFSSRVQGLGGACGDLPVLTIEEVDSHSVDLPGYVADAAPMSPLVPPRVVYRVSAVEGGAIAGLSLSDDTPTDACMYYNLLHPEQGLAMFATQLQVDSYEPSESEWFFPSVDEAKAYAETAEYSQLVRILSSLQFSTP